MGCIYIAINRVNNKCYVGQTFDTLEYRKKCHKKESQCKKTPKTSAFYCAIRKYGFESFDWFELYTNVDKEELDKLEDEEIKRNNTLSPNGYNLRTGGSAGRHSEETKQKLREANLGKPSSLKGKTIVDIHGEKKAKELLDKMSKNRKGKGCKPCSDEKKKKIGDVQRGKKRASHSQATKDKIRKAHSTPEQKARQSNLMKGRKTSDETKEKISKALKGRKRSDEYRAKIKESWKKRKMKIEMEEK